MKQPKYAKSSKYIGRGLSTFNQKEALISEIKKSETKLKLLEIGCGQGILLMELEQMFPGKLELHGINLDETHGIKSREDFRLNAKEVGINIGESTELPEIYFADATNLPFHDEEFDIVISQVTFLHIHNKAKAIQEVYRILKVGGLGLISIGPYSISKKHNKPIPEFYTGIKREIAGDLNPRMLIRDESGYKKFSEFIEELSGNYNIKLWTHEFESDAQKAKGFWLIIRKQSSDLLKMPLEYDEEQSRELTDKYGKGNPVNYGWIDVYEKVDE